MLIDFQDMSMFREGSRSHRQQKLQSLLDK